MTEVAAGVAGVHGRRDTRLLPPVISDISAVKLEEEGQGAGRTMSDSET